MCINSRISAIPSLFDSLANTKPIFTILLFLLIVSLYLCVMCLGTWNGLRNDNLPTTFRKNKIVKLCLKLPMSSGDKRKVVRGNVVKLQIALSFGSSSDETRVWDCHCQKPVLLWSLGYNSSTSVHLPLSRL